MIGASYAGNSNYRSANSPQTNTFSGQSGVSSEGVLTCTVSYKPSGTLASSTYDNYLTASVAAAGGLQALSGYATLSVTE